MADSAPAPPPAGPVTLARSIPYTFGRPTKYRPEFCDRVVELGAEGYSLAMIAFDLAVDRITLGRWADQYSDFRTAILAARASSLAWWESQGRAGIWSRDFNAPAYRLQVLNRFPDDWRDVTESRSLVAKLDMSRLPDALVARIAAGEPVAAVLASAAAPELARLTAGAPQDAPLEVPQAPAAADPQPAESAEPGAE